MSVVLIEVKNEDGTWPGQHCLAKSSTATSRNFTTSSKSSASSYSSVSATSVITNGDSSNSYGLNSSHLGRGGSAFGCNSYNCRDSASLSQPGLCGLSNLGNTCFMNSALQCLSNTPPLTDYFLEDKYEAEINQNNPLGMRGEIAEAYADLIKQMWSGRQSHVAPRMFKTQVGRFAPQFSGYQQQDSQELLAFLLDGLHEDLNRVKKKPYLELKDANGRPDSEVAKEAWENHRLRNDSIIVDIFHGLFKSTLYRVVVPMMGAISDLCESLSKLSGVPVENVRINVDSSGKPSPTRTSGSRSNGSCWSLEPAYKGSGIAVAREIIKMTDLDSDMSAFCMYEVCKPSEDGSEYVTLSIYFREKTMRQSSSTSGTVLFGQPLLISVPKHKLTVDHLYSVVLQQISRCVKLPLAEEYSPPCPDRGTCNGSNGVVEGDIEEMEHQDGGEEGKEKLTEVDPCHSEGFAIDWDSETRRLLYDEQEAQVAFEKHGSMLQPQKKKAVVALRDCIELFTTMETLGEHDPWYCPNCKKHQQATKKFDLWSLPRILVVHLKRFSYSRYWRDKLDTVVEFPIRGLNMSEFVCDPRAGSYVYDLIAVSNHYGAMGNAELQFLTLTDTAYAKNKVNDKWYYFDDSSVSVASEDQIVTKAAYVLFYQRRNSEEHSAPSAPQEEGIKAACDCTTEVPAGLMLSCTINTTFAEPISALELHLKVEEQISDAAQTLKVIFRNTVKPIY
ncbi:hypothetical protein IHE44_0003471 [Lamprotornis superbus]|uniref:ubiquitinyl hydrolase 1 n=1 Tax=Lamprotornis superbus TaxID=245042 RepID=A0A835TX60_9PASS|nr:hypothetical protein IHE44_0003471 [Lamprotornis superbus]